MLVTGSLYVVGAARTALRTRGRPHDPLRHPRPCPRLQAQRPVLVRQRARSSSAATGPPPSGSCPGTLAPRPRCPRRIERPPCGRHGGREPIADEPDVQVAPTSSTRMRRTGPAGRERAGPRSAPRSPPASPPTSSTRLCHDAASPPAATRARSTTTAVVPEVALHLGQRGHLPRHPRQPAAARRRHRQPRRHPLPRGRPRRHQRHLPRRHGRPRVASTWCGSPASASTLRHRGGPARASPRATSAGRSRTTPRPTGSASCGPSSATASARSSTPASHIPHYYEPRDATHRDGAGDDLHHRADDHRGRLAPPALGRRLDRRHRRRPPHRPVRAHPARHRRRRRDPHPPPRRPLVRRRRPTRRRARHAAPLRTPLEVGAAVDRAGVVSGTRFEPPSKWVPPSTRGCRHRYPVRRGRPRTMPGSVDGGLGRGRGSGLPSPP